jgi:hypothetical protein
MNQAPTGMARRGRRGGGCRREGFGGEAGGEVVGTGQGAGGSERDRVGEEGFASLFFFFSFSFPLFDF